MASLRLPPVRILWPTLWCAAAVSTIYVGCAAAEVRRDAVVVRKVRQRRGLVPARATMHDLDDVRAMIAMSNGRVRWVPPPSPSQARASPGLAETWAELPEAGKLMVGIVAPNLCVFSLERLLPGMAALFSHVPVSGANFTLLTCAFGHAGLTHLALNMYGVVQFLPPVAASPTFAASGCHLAAFYLSSGVLASLAYHVASVWPRPLDRMVPARGASGAVMAVVGAFGMAYPEEGLGIVLVPGFSLPAAQFLAGLTVFETYGLFVGFKRLPLAHAAHLAGLGLGAGYVYFDGQAHVWRPLKQWAFRQMRRLDLV